MMTTARWYDDDMVREVRYDDDNDGSNQKFNGLNGTPDFCWCDLGTLLYY